MLSTLLVIKAASEEIQQQQLLYKPVCTYKCIPKGRERERDAPEGRGGGQRWQKTGDADLTTKADSGNACSVLELFVSLFYFSTRNHPFLVL